MPDEAAYPGRPGRPPPAYGAVWGASRDAWYAAPPVLFWPCRLVPECCFLWRIMGALCHVRRMCVHVKPGCDDRCPTALPARGRPGSRAGPSRETVGMETIPTDPDSAISSLDTTKHESPRVLCGMPGEPVDGCVWGGGRWGPMASMWFPTRKRWGWRPSRPTLTLPSCICVHKGLLRVMHVGYGQHFVKSSASSRLRVYNLVSETHKASPCRQWSVPQH